jgi:hypothetical protein
VTAAETEPGNWGERWSAEEVGLYAPSSVCPKRRSPNGLRFIDVLPDAGSRALLLPLTIESLRLWTTCSARLFARQHPG